MVVPLNRAYSDIACCNRRVQNIVRNSVGVLIPRKYLITRQESKTRFSVGFVNCEMLPCNCFSDPLDIQKFELLLIIFGSPKGLSHFFLIAEKYKTEELLKTHLVLVQQNRHPVPVPYLFPLKRSSSLYTPRYHIVDENTPATTC